ncbi:MAG: hypothetical protein PWP15_905 [Methanothermococcus sp.]|jgi:hypothetical protein|uniref:Uncharacterized protein n=1 Tax=Methanococcus maripaludis KA1 TaxID=637914 RepID=A0A2Z5PFV6_METMI|nr:MULTISPECIES: hypothetical protein [Methanococcaceae]MDK2790398.1 hypothetical protein [Methanothermococcus sp.]MDK2987491.1 hypothetical protein [Methanothermococcus sp.]BAP61203.1 hypothetical protein MMKA1_10860 [Methanococcus maripaludis KA1]
MKCPYCGENCVDEYILELYIKSLKNFKMRKNTAFNGIPIVCEAGVCKNTGKRIWYCPHCKSLTEYVDSFNAIVQCPNCHEKIALPATNRTVC